MRLNNLVAVLLMALVPCWVLSWYAMDVIITGDTEVCLMTSIGMGITTFPLVFFVVVLLVELQDERRTNEETIERLNEDLASKMRVIRDRTELVESLTNENDALVKEVHEWQTNYQEVARRERELYAAKEEPAHARLQLLVDVLGMTRKSAEWLEDEIRRVQ